MKNQFNIFNFLSFCILVSALNAADPAVIYFGGAVISEANSYPDVIDRKMFPIVNNENVIAQSYDVRTGFAQANAINELTMTNGEIHFTYSAGVQTNTFTSRIPRAAVGLQLRFDLTVPMNFSLGGDTASNANPGWSLVEVWLTSYDAPVGTGFLAYYGIGSSTVNFPNSQASGNLSGLLQPGRYALTTELVASPDESTQSAGGSYAGYFDLTPVPEPSTFGFYTLIGLVVAGYILGREGKKA